MHANLTARTDAFPFSDPAFCLRAWLRLEAAWPRPLAACLMGNHLHLLVPGDPQEEATRLARVLNHLQGPVFRAAGTPSEGRVKLRRDIRYIALNPCRARLAADPLEWAWSTHRDMVGAVARPWVDRRTVLALEYGRDPLASHHRYVSGDPHVSVRSTPLPRAARNADISEWPLRAVMNAALAATRGGAIFQRPTRTMFFQLARDHGWTRVTRLAEIGRCSRATVYRAWSAPDICQAARVCLGDARLRRMLLPTDPR